MAVFIAKGDRDTQNRSVWKSQSSFPETLCAKLSNLYKPVGRGEGISGEKGEGFVGAITKDMWTITGVGWKWEGGGESWGLHWGGGKRQKTVLEQQ